MGKYRELVEALGGRFIDVEAESSAHFDRVLTNEELTQLYEAKNEEVDAQDDYGKKAGPPEAGREVELLVFDEATGTDPGASRREADEGSPGSVGSSPGEAGSS